MNNSRILLQANATTDDSPSNTSRDFGKILENVYKPGFVDQDNMENIKMAVDRELGEVSKAFYQTSERTSDTIKRIDELVIDNDTLSARIEEVDFVSKAGDEALAQRITTVEADYKAADADLNASIVTETTARANADEALAQQITTVETEYKAADSTLNAAIVTETTARTTADQAIASSVTNLTATVTTNKNTQDAINAGQADKNGQLDASVVTLTASITNEATVRANADSALSSQISTVSAEYKAEDTAIRGDLADLENSTTGSITTLTASISNEATARANADSALASQISTVEAEYKVADIGLKNGYEADDAVIRASVVTETNARVTADSALASQISTVQSELGDDIASVQTYSETNITRIDGNVATTNGNVTALGNRTTAVEAKWGVRVNVNGKVTGIALNNNGSQSSFSVQADQFIINNGTTDSGAPFEVLGGVTKIKNAAVGTIQSDNWNGSTVGWQILKNGNATFNNVTVRGSVVATSFLGVGGSTLKIETSTAGPVSESGGWVTVATIGSTSLFDSLDNSIDVTISGYTSISASGNVDISLLPRLQNESAPTTLFGNISSRIYSGNNTYQLVPFTITRTGAQLKASSGIRIYARVLRAADTGHGGGNISSMLDIGYGNVANISVVRNA